MPKLPLPDPAKFPALTNEHRATTSGSFWRVCNKAGDHPSTWDQFRTFGPVGSRFDHHVEPPSEQDRGILYAARAPDTAIAEAFQKTRRINRSRRQPWLARFTLERPVVLLALHGSTWATQAGASTALMSGSRVVASRWSRQIYEHPPYGEIEGIRYASSMNDGREQIALYERAEDALPDNPDFDYPLTHPLMTPFLNDAAAAFGYGLI